MAKRETKLLHSQSGDEVPTLRRLEAKTPPCHSVSRRDTIDDLQATALSLYLNKRSNDDFHALLLLFTLYSLRTIFENIFEQVSIRYPRTTSFIRNFYSSNNLFAMLFDSVYKAYSKIHFASLLKSFKYNCTSRYWQC